MTTAVSINFLFGNDHGPPAAQPLSLPTDFDAVVFNCNAELNCLPCANPPLFFFALPWQRRVLSWSQSHRPKTMVALGLITGALLCSLSTATPENHDSAAEAHAKDVKRVAVIGMDASALLRPC